MNELYKYYSQHLDIINYLENPTIKLATTKSFNDPFEQELPSRLARDLAKAVSETRYIKGSGPKESIEKKLTKLYKNASESMGVISLTESHRNLLMWAHYADSHRGFCIGYKTNFLKNAIGINDDNDESEYTYPRKITYDKKRFDPIRHNECKLPHNIIMQILTTKSDEWIYEKEHRCITPIWRSNEFIFKGEQNSKEHKKIMEQEKLGRIINISKSSYRFKDDDGSAFYFDLTSEIANYISNLDSTTMLKSINIKDISSIFFGCRAPHQKISEIKELIQSNPERYGHLKVYQYKTNKENFDLDLKSVINSNNSFNHQALINNINGDDIKNMSLL